VKFLRLQSYLLFLSIWTLFDIFKLKNQDQEDFQHKHLNFYDFKFCFSVIVLPIPGKRSLRTIWDDFQNHLRTKCTGKTDVKLQDVLASHLYSEMVSMHESINKYPGKIESLTKKYNLTKRMINLLGQKISQYRKWPYFPFAITCFYFFPGNFFEAPNEKTTLKTRWEERRKGLTSRFFHEGFQNKFPRKK
jgi:hypothetical protein